MHEFAMSLSVLLISAPDCLRESLMSLLTQIAQDGESAAAVLAAAIAMVQAARQ